MCIYVIHCHLESVSYYQTQTHEIVLRGIVDSLQAALRPWRTLKATSVSTNKPEMSA